MFRVYSAHELDPNPVCVIKFRAIKKPGYNYCVLDGGLIANRSFFPLWLPLNTFSVIFKLRNVVFDKCCCLTW